MTVNRGKTLLQCTFAWLLATICLLTVFLCHNAFGDYRRQVEQTAQPDYEIEAPYAMSRSFAANDVLSTLQMEAGCTYGVVAGNVYLHCEELLEERNSPILTTLWESSEGKALFRAMPDGTAGFATRIIGAPEGGALLQQMLSLVPEGTVTEAELLSGEACILLVPRYISDGDGVQRKSLDADTLEAMDLDERTSALLELSFDPSMEKLTQADEAIKAGDIIQLTGFTQMVDGDGNRSDTTRSVRTRVAAVVSVLAEPIWPFSGSSTAYWVLSGDSLVYQTYPKAGTRMTAQQASNHRVMAKLFYPDCYGRTVFYMTNPADADGIAQDTAAANFAERFGLDFVNDRLQKDKIYSDAVKNVMMFLLLGVEMALVVLTILMATAASSVEQDRKRYGTLQAIGVSGGQLVRGQILQALGVALLSCVMANLAVALVIFVSAAIENLGKTLFASRVLLTAYQSLKDYPWNVHGIVCAAYILVYLVAQSSPIFRVSREDPITNIRS